ncbi:RNA-directed DNA polymerase from mobile element jockey [Plakobranchus ocellatus]|uniref:RNA-directed DNA polymerase from mobile element jockey n=1 Tax=Plakobranchus ocellatus TaxID=259542 RepID=A0AAV4CP51_9GAST|nr:RNA-directed DNA polymerase from mobile element jockey [Plakobranchus ocellatus]
MAQSFPHCTLHPYPNQGDLVQYLASADGLPQGSALSCTLFLIFMNIVLWQQDTDVEKATEAINQDLASLKRWKMQINTGMTAYTTFSLSKPVLKEDLGIRFGNDSLKRDDLPRYLGVSLDRRLCLRRHIEGVANSVQERTTILQKLVGTTWSAKPQSLSTIYISFI